MMPNTTTRDLIALAKLASNISRWAWSRVQYGQLSPALDAALEEMLEIIARVRGHHEPR